MKTTNYEFFKTIDDSNLKLRLNLLRAYPILSFTDEFIAKAVLSTETITVTPNNVTLRDDGVELKYLCKATCIKGNEVTFYYDVKNKYIISTFIDDSINPDDFKNSELQGELNVIGCTTSRINGGSNRLTVEYDNILRDLPIPNSLVGVTVTKLLLNTTGLDTVSGTHTVYTPLGIIGDMEVEISILEVLKISTVDLGYSDPLFLNTVFSTTPVLKNLLYLGRKSVSHIYIPII